jgi:hypothetical protein
MRTLFELLKAYQVLDKVYTCADEICESNGALDLV